MAPPRTDEPERIAAIDLGSNSFHMLIARIVDGEPVVVDRIRDSVRLAAGLGDDSLLTDESQERALDCLALFGQRMRETANLRARAVGTNTMRKARNAAQFIEKAEKVLGIPIEIISGVEEARMIYLGVAHSSAFEGTSQLVVDIGGGSTECILGRGFEAVDAHSFYMGCVSWQKEFFPDDGRVDKKNFRAAVMAAQSELLPIENQFGQLGFDEAFGASGTIRTVETVLTGLRKSGEGIDAEGIKTLGRMLVEGGHAQVFESAGLKSDRLPVFAGGLAILTAIFKTFDIDRMTVSPGALREGIIYDLMGRLRHEDVRERSIRNLEERYSVDRRQSTRVERCSRRILKAVVEPWGLDIEESQRLLSWAARLHEIGLAVSWSQHQKHGAYLIANSNLPGFSRDDQALLAVLVGSQRRKVKNGAFSDLNSRLRPKARFLLVVHRLSVLLHRSRSEEASRRMKVDGEKDRLILRFPSGFADRHPLTLADLDKGRRDIAEMGIELVIEQRS